MHPIDQRFHDLLATAGPPAGVDILARPGQLLRVRLRAGDVLVRVAPGEPGLGCMVELADGDVSPLGVLMARGAAVEEGARGGGYALVRGGAGAGPALARQIVDTDGVVPPYQLVLRQASAAAAAEPHEHDDAERGAPILAPPPKTLQVAADGLLYRADDLTRAVGRQLDASQGFVGALDGGTRPAPLDAAGFGDMTVGSRFYPLVLAEAVELSPAPAGTTAAAGFTAIGVKYTGKLSVRLHSGAIVLRPHATRTWSGGKDGLSAALAASIDERARVRGPGGRVWSWIEYRTKKSETFKGAWVPQKETPANSALRRAEMSTEIQRLPAGSDARKAAEDNLGIITSIVIHEGGFDAGAHGEDPSASVGFFQWSMEQNGTKGTLAVLLGRLAKRAADALAKPAAARSEIEKLYIAAWQQCLDHGMRVQGGKIFFNGSTTAATGGEVQAEMRREFGKKALRTYQFVAAVDSIRGFAARVVRPGSRSWSGIGHGYDEVATLTVQLAHKGWKLELEPDEHAKVGDFFTSKKSLATAVNIGIGRDSFLVTALWRALHVGRDPRGERTMLLDALVDYLEAVGTKKSRLVRQADVASISPDAMEAWTAVKAIIWPMPSGIDEETLVYETRRQAIELNNIEFPGDTVKYDRPRRFATIESLPW